METQQITPEALASLPLWSDAKSDPCAGVLGGERGAEDIFADSLTLLPPETLTKVFLTQVEGRPVGYAGCRYEPSNKGSSIQARVIIHIEPAFRRQGIGRRLSGLLETAARQDGIHTFDCYSRLEAGTKAFAQAQGWHEVYREFILGAESSRVPPATLPSPFRIEFVWRTACTEALVKQLYAVFQVSFPAIASFWSVPTLYAAMTKERSFNGIAIAYLEAQVVGFAWGLDAAPNAVFSEFTGVRPEYQGQGIGTALKSELAGAARQTGRSRMITSNRGGNQTMLAVNQRIGYETEVTMALFQKA